MISGKCAKMQNFIQKHANMQFQIHGMRCKFYCFIWAKMLVHVDASVMQPELERLVNLFEQFFLGGWNQVTRRRSDPRWSWHEEMMSSLSIRSSWSFSASKSGWIENKMKLLQEHSSLLQQIFVRLWILTRGNWRMIFFYGCVCFVSLLTLPASSFAVSVDTP